MDWLNEEDNDISQIVLNIRLHNYAEQNIYI